jgi:hypothetical protein
LQLSRRGVFSLLAMGMIALAVVAAFETLARLDPHPKALPFESTRTGTIVDYLRSTKPRLDFLFLGSSQCAYNVSPDDFIAAYTGAKVEAFNAGIPGAGIIDVNALYQNLFTEVPVKHVVIFATLSGALAPQDRRLLDNYGSDYVAGRLSVPEDALMQLHLFRYRMQWRDLRYQVYALRDLSLAGDLERRLGPHGRGWWPGQGRWEAEADLNDADAATPTADDSMQRAFQERGWTAPPQVFTSLGQAIRTAQARGASVTLAIPPHPPRFMRLMRDPEGDWTRFTAQMQQLARDTGSRFLDHHRLPDFDDRSFFDHTHLKTDEARRYSRVLARALGAMVNDPPTFADAAR